LKAGSDISPEAVQQRLTTEFVGRHFLYYPTVTSTMDVARKAAKEGASEGTVVVAEEQTVGRARLGRSWINPPGVMAVSIIIRPEMNQLIRLTMVAALATSRCIEKATRLKTTIKWPNDVLVNGKKISGILTESALRGQSVDWAVIGIGININFDPKAYPEIADIATSLSVELGKEVSQLNVLVHLLSEIESYYLALRRGEPIHEDWRSKLETLGKLVQVKTGTEVEKGYAESVGEDGALLLRRPDGTLVRIVAGEVTLRP
jgi:BirA family biotin operon repressor/biotin-[acetyl-CoA-carboxylase] ligase